MAFRESIGTPGAGIMMGMDGSPMMTGTWVNPKTGHKFTVQDCFFQDGNFMVQTTDGRMLDYNTIQNYVQTTDKVPEASRQPQVKKEAKPKPVQESLPEDIMNEILPEDMEAIGLGNINDERVNALVKQSQQTSPDVVMIDPDVVMIEKVLKKHSSPQPMVSIDWQPVPRKQMETLVDILGVEPQAIADYYISKIDTAQLIDTVKKAIVECVNNIVGTNPVSESSEVIEPAPVKAPKKKSTKKNKK